jgi:glycerophosphoryl diester phosphodiesterase
LIIWSHRGYPGPENTLKAFEAAWEDGITHFETDIHATLDGYLVLAHDPSILRLTQVDQQISTLTLKQLQEFPIDGQHPWCTLEELVIRFPDAQISIDIKSDDTLHPFIQWMNGRQAENFVVGSFSTKRVQSFRQAHPSVRTALTPLETLALVFGLDRSIRWDETTQHYAMVPPSFRGIPICTSSFIKRCRSRGISIFVWTINDLETARALVEKGAHGVITDKYPELR